MDNKDYEYIQKEFDTQKEHNMKPIKVTKQLIDKLLNKYNACAFTELYYDDWATDEDRATHSKKYTDEEWKDYKKNYDKRGFNNWYDPYEEGNWGFTNNKIRKMTRNELNELKKYQYTSPNNIRFYINENEKISKLYFYGRDLDIQCDFWFGFYNKEVSRCLTCRKDLCWRSSICGEKII